MIEMKIPQRRRSLGGFEVGRVLPAAERRMVGPFVFFDHMGPLDMAPGVSRTVDVRPHPHIGLATVTYLFSGEILHRDSVGSEQAIRPGEVNWMVAGRGITHSERFERARREGDHRSSTLTSPWLRVQRRQCPVNPNAPFMSRPAPSSWGQPLRGGGDDRPRAWRRQPSRARAVARHAARRRTLGRAVFVLEFRIVLKGADRTGQGRLARPTHQTARSRSRRVYPIARGGASPRKSAR